MTYRIYSINHPGRLFESGHGAYKLFGLSGWALIRGGAVLINFLGFQGGRSFEVGG